MTAQFRSNLGKFLTSHHASLQNEKKANNMKCKKVEGKV